MTPVIDIKGALQTLNLQLKVAATRQQVTVEDRAGAAVTTDASSNANALVLRGADLDAGARRADVVIAGLPEKGEPLASEWIQTIGPKVIVLADSVLPATRRASPDSQYERTNPSIRSSSSPDARGYHPRTSAARSSGGSGSSRFTNSSSLCTASPTSVAASPVAPGAAARRSSVGRIPTTRSA